jgi:hypothetical protein
MEKKIPYAVTHEDNIALLDYISSNLVSYSSKYPRKHFSIYADSKPDQFGKSKSYRRIILQKTLSNWLSRGRIPIVIISNHDQTLIQSAQLSLNFYLNAKSDVDNSTLTTTTTTTSTTTSSKSASKTMNFMSPGGAVNLMSNPDHAAFNCGTLQVDVEYKRNLQGVVPVIAPACPEITLKEPTGTMDKLLVEIPMFDICDKSKYKAWLQPEGKGIFISIPATGGRLFKERVNNFNVNKQFPADQDQFQHRYQRTYDAYKWMMEGKTDNVHNTMTVYWDFPQDTICSNAHFNKDELGASQTNPFVLHQAYETLGDSSQHFRFNEGRDRRNLSDC